MGPGLLRVGERLLRSRRTGGYTGLEGVAVRLAGPGQRHHRRQATRSVVGDGIAGQAVRLQRVHHVAAASVDGSGFRRGAVRGGPSGEWSRRGPDRRRRLGVDTGRRIDVSVQQPRRAAGAANGGRRVLHAAGHRDREQSVDRPGGLRARVRVPDQDAAGVPSGARSGARVPHRGAGRRRASVRQVGDRRSRDDRLGRLVSPPGRAVARRLAAVYRWLVRQQRAAARVELQRD
jgi:hypothetical protein